MFVFPKHPAQHLAPPAHRYTRRLPFFNAFPSLSLPASSLQALAAHQALNKVQIGSELTRGLGCGGNPELGRRAAMESEEALRRMVQVSADRSGTRRRAPGAVASWYGRTAWASSALPLNAHAGAVTCYL